MSGRMKFNQTVKNLRQAKDKNGQYLDIKGIKVTFGNEVYREIFEEKTQKYNIRSLSKTIMALCLQEADRSIQPETLIKPFFEDIEAVNSDKKIERIKIKHLLSHSIGHEKGFLFESELEGIGKENLLTYIFEKNMVYEPGVHFAYSNAGFYLLSALMERKTGKSFDRIADEVLLQKMGIWDFKWRKYGPYTAGCTGLEMNIDDLSKISLLILNKGKFEGRQIIEESWLEEIQKPVFSFETPLGLSSVLLPQYGYGYGIWLGSPGVSFGEGAGGQYMIIVPEKEMTITILSTQKEMSAIVPCLYPLLCH